MRTRQRRCNLRRDAPSVDPATVQRWLRQGHDDAGRRVVMLDTRNREEFGFGTFAGALTLPIDKFTDLPAALEPHLQALKDATEVYIATDPDREGESIAWHIQQALGIREYKRVTFNEITQARVREGLANARRIDGQLVASQECRRVLDRLVGYKIEGDKSSTEVQGDLAESWSTSADNLTWDFKLKPGNKFDDGTAVDAVEAVGLHVVREAAGAADARYEDRAFRRQVLVAAQPLHSALCPMKMAPKFS